MQVLMLCLAGGLVNQDSLGRGRTFSCSGLPVRLLTAKGLVTW